MNADRINQKIYAGSGKAALRIGYDYDVYRPAHAADPLTNKVETLKVGFNSGDNKYLKPNMPGDMFWFADMDGRYVAPGDYLVRGQDIRFVAAMQSLLPIIVIECNAKVYITRQAAEENVGAVGYGGLTDAKQVAVVGASESPWPAAIVFGGRSNPSAELPASVKNAGWRVYLPPSVPAECVIKAGDIITDDLGRRYTIEGAEKSETGWRINAQEAHT